MTAAMTLLEVVERLGELGDELTIYVVEPWECGAAAVVAAEPEAGGRPREAKRVNALYFIEVFMAREFLDGWRSSAEGRRASTNEACRRLIEYAVSDA